MKVIKRKEKKENDDEPKTTTSTGTVVYTKEFCSQVIFIIQYPSVVLEKIYVLK